jgi:hypothetical protein
MAERKPPTDQLTPPPERKLRAEAIVVEPPGRLRVNSESKYRMSPCSGLTARPTAPEPQAAMAA